MVNYFEKLEVQLFPEEIGDNGSILKNTAEKFRYDKIHLWGLSVVWKSTCKSMRRGNIWGWGTKLDQELYYGKAYIISKEVLSIEHRRHC